MAKLLEKNINLRMDTHKLKVPSCQWSLGRLFVLFCTIPWVNFGLNSMDSQPWPVVFGLLYLLTLSINFGYKKFVFLLFGLVSFSLAVGLLRPETQIDFLLFRGVTNYFSFFILLFAFMGFLKKNGLPLNILVVINVVWLIAGILQVISPGMLTAFVVERTTIDRGVTSLAPEPTFFAIYLFFNTWIILISSSYRPTRKLVVLVLINIFAILVLAMSSMGAVYLLVSIVLTALFLCFRKKINKNVVEYGVLTVGLLIVVSVLILYFFEDSRLVKLISIASSTPWINLFELDASINLRLSHVVLPFHGFFYNYGIPGGFHGFGALSQNLAASYDGYFWYGLGDNKIMSWIGSFLYELGWGGLIFIIILFASLLDGTRRRTFELILLFILLLSAVPVAFPLIPLIFASFIHNRNN